MKYIFILLILFSSAKLFGQQSIDSSFVMVGYVIDEDSIPVENANVIVFSSLKVYQTNAEGRFAIPLYLSDSLMIYHSRFERKVIYPSIAKSQSKSLYKVEFLTTEIQQVDVNSPKLMQNFNKNMADMNYQMKNTQIPVTYTHGNDVVNKYSPKANNSLFGANLFELFSLIKRKPK